MHHVFRSSLLPVVAIMAVAAFSGCQTHDRRVYTGRHDKNLHTPNPWAPSTTKAADEATSDLPPAPEAQPGSSSVAPGSGGASMSH
jgi:hypothetical protein